MATSSETNAPRYLFDDVVVDCGNYEVFKGGERKVLTARAFDVLCHLIERRGRVVEKAELFEQVWKERFVTDNALTRVVADIRQALGDSAAAPRYIETIPKRGYRFVAEVCEGSEPAAACDGERVVNLAPNATEGQPPTAPPVSPQPAAGACLRPGRVTRRRLAGALLLIFALAVGALSVFLLKGGRAPSASVAVIPVTDPRGGPAAAEAEPAAVGGVRTKEARAAVAKMPLAPKPENESRRPEGHADNPEAVQLYLKGLRLLDTLDPDKAEQAAECFRQAVELDPRYALGYVGLADYYLNGPKGGTRTREYVPLAQAAVARALELDETLAEAHATRGLVYDLYDWDGAAAERELRRATELNPSSGLVRRDLAVHLTLQGRTDEALAESRKALALDPYNARLNLNVGWILYGTRQHEQALTHFRQMIAAGLYVPGSYSWLAQIYEAQGRYEQAVEMDIKYRSLSRAAPRATLESFRAAYAASGWEGYWQKVLEQRESVAARKYVEPYGFAAIYARLGEKEQAFRWLEKAYLERSIFMTRLTLDPGFDSLRAEPRFRDLMRRLGPAAARQVARAE
jgi:DNA-binding winged helix-turn-helix (wHTH) protein/Tfp pilus assembly protein PilF